MNYMDNILVVGSYAVAMFIKTPRMPIFGETLIGSDFFMGPGGKGSNQAIAISRLGGKVSFICFVGNDALGDEAFNLFKKEKINIELIKKTKKSTGVGFVILNDDGENGIILDMGSNNELDLDYLNEIKEELPKYNFVLSGFEIPFKTALYSLKLSKQNGSVTILNPAPAINLVNEDLSFIDYVTPNESELRICLGMKPDAQNSNSELAEKLFRNGINNLVVTEGEKGCLIINNDINEHVPGVKVDVVDTTGAGDAFNAGLTVALSEGKNIIESLKFANCCGAFTCTKAGVVNTLAYRHEIDLLYNDNY